MRRPALQASSRFSLALSLVLTPAACSSPRASANPPASAAAAPRTTCTPRIAQPRVIVDRGVQRGTVAVTAPAGCAWGATSALDWLKPAGAGGTGAGALAFTVSPNPGPDRVGVIDVSGATVVVLQRGTGLTPGHPRLWLRAADLPRLRSWARDDNPVWSEALMPRVRAAIEAYDTRYFPKGKRATPWPDDNTDGILQLAFHSLVAPDLAARADAARRARTQFVALMEDLDRRGAGTKDERYPLTDNFRYTGEHWGLLTDWLYPVLSDADRALIRRVLLRFAERHAEHSGWMRDRALRQDPALVAKPGVVRWLINNWTTAMARNLLLETVAFDDEHDPPLDPRRPPLATRNSLRAYRDEALRSLLYMQHHLLKEGGDASGGVPPEGAYYYGQEATSFLFHGLLGLFTAGYLDWQKYGDQVTLTTDRYLKDLVTYFVHGMAPRPEAGKFGGYRIATTEQTRVPSTGGSGPVTQLGPLAVLGQLTGDQTLRDRVRWILADALGGGPEKRTEHYRYNATTSILAFLALDPALPSARDFRPSLSRTFHAPALGRISARTDWGPDASWFHATCSWKSIDHQIENCGSFMLWRRGEWITDPRNGYSDSGLLDVPDYWNTFAIQKVAKIKEDSMTWARGGETRYNAGDPRTAISDHPRFLYVEADATNLHNRTPPAPPEVAVAQRAFVWLRPDALVIYDRTATAAKGRWKRFWMNLPGKPRITGRTVRSATRSGQQLRLDSLLPARVSIAERPWERDGGAAVDEPMVTHVAIEEPTRAADVRFLHVLQAFDKGAEATGPRLLQVSGPREFHGAQVGKVAVLFAVAPTPTSAAGLSFTVAPDTDLVVITGLAPSSRYDVSFAKGSVRVVDGARFSVDAQGVLAATP